LTSHYCRRRWDAPPPLGHPAPLTDADAPLPMTAVGASATPAQATIRLRLRSAATCSPAEVTWGWTSSLSHGRSLATRGGGQSMAMADPFHLGAVLWSAWGGGATRAYFAPPWELTSGTPLTFSSRSRSAGERGRCRKRGSQRRSYWMRRIGRCDARHG
jgi:hypothetical protein